MMSVDPTKYENLSAADLEHPRGLAGGLGLVDLLPALGLIAVVLVVGAVVSFNETGMSVLFAQDGWTLRVMIGSALLAVAALYFSYRSAQWTAERETMRFQANLLLSRLDRLDGSPSPEHSGQAESRFVRHRVTI